MEKGAEEVTSPEGQESTGTEKARPVSHSSRPIVKPTWLANQSTGNGKKKGTEETRALLAANRAATRASRLQQARENSVGQSESSPELRTRTSGKRRGDELEEGLQQERKQKMDEDFKAFVDTVKSKLDSLPTREQFDSLGIKIEQIGENTRNIEQNKEEIEKNKSDLASIKESISRLERDQVDARRSLSGKVREIVQTSPCSSGSFERARRSIRMWPIQGRSDGEMKMRIGEFMKDALQMTDLDESVGDFSVTRPAETKGKGVVYDEVIVFFATPVIRDFVFKQGFRLAEYVDEERKPTCGIRINIPEPMLPTFNMLQRYGFLLKRRHRGLKKYIKFDDYKKSLFIQVRLDMESEWMNVSPEEANSFLADNDKRKNLRSCSLRSPTHDHVDNYVERKKPSDGDAMEEGEDEVFILPPQKKVWQPPPRQKKKE